MKINEPSAIIIAAIITSIIAVLIAFFQNYYPITPQCTKIKERAEKYSGLLNDRLSKAKDDRELINLTFWRDKFKEISLYSCKDIDVQFEKIITSFEKASKQLDL